MNKATPIPDSIETIANGSMQKASCALCGKKITRGVNSQPLPWWHVETALGRCAELGGKQK